MAYEVYRTSNMLLMLLLLLLPPLLLIASKYLKSHIIKRAEKNDGGGRDRATSN